MFRGRFVKIINTILFCILYSAILLGCDSRKAGVLEESITDSTEQFSSENVTEIEDTIETGVVTETEDTTETKVATETEDITETKDVTEIEDIIETGDATETKVATETKDVTEIVALTEQELVQWTNYVNSRENNAFLLSYYDEPKKVDLHELFYTGCGLDMEEMTDKEVQEYLEVTGMDEIYTDITCLTSEQIQSVLKLRLGLTMEEMEQPLGWYYLPDSDIYVMQHGDTNVQNFTCIDGSKNGNQVVLDCLSEMTGTLCRVTLELPENSEIWMFVSNERIVDELSVEEENDSES